MDTAPIARLDWHRAFRRIRELGCISPRTAIGNRCEVLFLQSTHNPFRETNRSAGSSATGSGPVSCRSVVGHFWQNEQIDCDGSRHRECIATCRSARDRTNGNPRYCIPQHFKARCQGNCQLHRLDFLSRWKVDISERCQRYDQSLSRYRKSRSAACLHHSTTACKCSSSQARDSERPRVQ